MGSLTMLYVWIGITVLFGVLEAATVGLTSIWFALGALFAMIAAALGAELWLQITIFIAMTALMLIITRPLVKRFLVPKIEKTNAQSLIGQIAIVTEQIDNDEGRGAVRIGGKTWTARSENGNAIEVEQKVVVIRIEGVKLFVRL